MDKLIRLARQGATVIMHRNQPSKVPGFYQAEKKTEKLNELISQLHFKPAESEGVKVAPAGKGFFLAGDDLAALLSAAKIRREAMVEKGLLFVRRQAGNGTSYVISNSGNSKIEGWVPLSGKELSVALYDPMLERNGIAQTRKSVGGTTEVFLQLNPGESCVLQSSSKPFTGNAFPYITLTGKPEVPDGEWEIRFTDGGPGLPPAATVKALGSWTALTGEEVKKFSGTAQYSTSWKKPKYTPHAWLIDLGVVGESAEVLLNGEKIRTLIGPVFQVLIPASILKADNLLQVNVTNGMANRIADMDKRKVEWKKFYNVNFPSRLARNRNEEGIFDASGWAPKASGLIGPVTITPVKLGLVD